MDSAEAVKIINKNNFQIDRGMIRYKGKLDVDVWNSLDKKVKDAIYFLTDEYDYSFTGII